MATAPVSSKLEALSMSDTKVVVPWLALPDYLAEKILERLPVFDYIRFGAVCRHWRSIQTAHRIRHAPAPPPMVNLPCFIPRRPDQESVICFLGLFHGNLNNRRSRQHLHIPLSPRYREYLASEEEEETQGGGRDDWFFASASLPYGWLLFDDWPSPDHFDRGYLFTLLNPITGFQIQLPTLGGLYHDFKATMSPPPRCDVLLFTWHEAVIELHLCRLGSPCWTRLEYPHGYFRFEDLIDLCNASAIHYNGKFYCFFSGKGFMVVDVDCPIEEDGITIHYLEMDQSQLPKVENEIPPVLNRLILSLVESNGKLLLVSRIFEYDKPIFEDFRVLPLKRFELCEADLVNRRWVKMESLGDQSLFIYGNFAVSLLAADVGAKENCIYSLDPPMRVFDFGTGMVADASFPCHSFPSPHLMFVPSIY